MHFSPLNLPDDLQQDDLRLSGAISTLLNRFNSDSAQKFGLAAKDLQLINSQTEQNPIYTWNRLAHEAAKALLENNVIRSENGRYHLNPHGFFLGENAKKLSVHSYPSLSVTSSPLAGESSTRFFVRRLKPGAHVLENTAPLGVCTGFQLKRTTGFEPTMEATWSLRKS